jgi:hypothetical protein
MIVDLDPNDAVDGGRSDAQRRTGGLPRCRTLLVTSSDTSRRTSS